MLNLYKFTPKFQIHLKKCWKTDQELIVAPGWFSWERRFDVFRGLKTPTYTWSKRHWWSFLAHCNGALWKNTWVFCMDSAFSEWTNFCYQLYLLTSVHCNCLFSINACILMSGKRDINQSDIAKDYLKYANNKPSIPKKIQIRECDLYFFYLLHTFRT